MPNIPATEIAWLSGFSWAVHPVFHNAIKRREFHVGDRLYSSASCWRKGVAVQRGDAVVQVREVGAGRDPEIVVSIESHDSKQDRVKTTAKALTLYLWTGRPDALEGEMQTDRHGQPIAAFNRSANQDKNLEHLFGICRGLIADQQLNDDEIYFLDAWLRDFQELEHTPLAKLIINPVRDVLADDIVTDDERRYLVQTLKQFVGDGMQEYGTPRAMTMGGLVDDGQEVVIPGNTFCITGKADRSRADLVDIIEKHAGTISKGVNRKVDYMLLGAEASRDWKYSAFGNKIRRAMELREEGYPIAFATEEQLVASI